MLRHLSVQSNAIDVRRAFLLSPIKDLVADISENLYFRDAIPRTFTVTKIIAAIRNASGRFISLWNLQTRRFR